MIGRANGLFAIYHRPFAIYHYPDIQMLRYLVRRLLLTIPVLLGVATLVFALIHLVPGDPAQAMLGEGAAPEELVKLRHSLGLDQPLLAPSPDERTGYVPNVVYSCGGLVHNKTLVIPYGISDAATGFATVRLDDLLARLG